MLHIHILYINIFDSVAPVKNVRVKANSKPWFVSEIVTALQNRDQLYSR